jgi:hypothetical protein
VGTAGHNGPVLGGFTVRKLGGLTVRKQQPGRRMPRTDRRAEVAYQAKVKAAMVIWRAEQKAQQAAQNAPGRATTVDDPQPASA